MRHAVHLFIFSTIIRNLVLIDNVKFNNEDSSSNHNDNPDTLYTSDICLIKSILASGHSVELPAKGMSMFPTIRSGDKVIVKPLAKGEFPISGQVVVYENNKVFVMHRILEIIYGSSGVELFITRGDSGIEHDKPWPQQQIVGVAISYKRGGKEHLIKTLIPGTMRYLTNRRILWLFNMIKKLNTHL
jgi:signal peptidase I